MEIALLAQTAMTLAYPFLKKIGEGASRKIGEDIWSLIKNQFQSNGKDIAYTNSEQLKIELEDLLSENEKFKAELEAFINSHQPSSVQQNIQNNAAVAKQAIITTNTGNINF